MGKAKKPDAVKKAAVVKKKKPVVVEKVTPAPSEAPVAKVTAPKEVAPPAPRWAEFKNLGDAQFVRWTPDYLRTRVVLLQNNDAITSIIELHGQRSFVRLNDIPSIKNAVESRQGEFTLRIGGTDEVGDKAVWSQWRDVSFSYQKPEENLDGEGEEEDADESRPQLELPKNDHSTQVVAKPTGLAISDELVATWDKGVFTAFELKVVTTGNIPVALVSPYLLTSFDIRKSNEVWPKIVDKGPGIYYFILLGRRQDGKWSESTSESFRYKEQKEDVSLAAKAEAAKAEAAKAEAAKAEAAKAEAAKAEAAKAEADKLKKEAVFTAAPKGLTIDDDLFIAWMRNGFGLYLFQVLQQVDSEKEVEIYREYRKGYETELELRKTPAWKKIRVNGPGNYVVMVSGVNCDPAKTLSEPAWVEFRYEEPKSLVARAIDTLTAKMSIGTLTIRKAVGLVLMCILLWGAYNAPALIKEWREAKENNAAADKALAKAAAKAAATNAKAAADTLKKDIIDSERSAADKDALARARADMPPPRRFTPPPSAPAPGEGGDEVVQPQQKQAPQPATVSVGGKMVNDGSVVNFQDNHGVVNVAVYSSTTTPPHQTKEYDEFDEQPEGPPSKTVGVPLGITYYTVPPGNGVVYKRAEGTVLTFGAEKHGTTKPYKVWVNTASMEDPKWVLAPSYRNFPEATAYWVKSLDGGGTRVRLTSRPSGQ